MNILFVHTNLKVGGIEKSLVNLANLLNKKGHKIQIVLFHRYGELLNKLDSNIEVIEADKDLRVFATPKIDSKKFGLMFYIKRNLFAIRKKIFKNTNYADKIITKIKDKFECDIAVAYTDDFLVSSYVLNNVKARKKFMFYHSDFRNKDHKIYEKYGKIAQKFDKYICVSESCKNVAVKLCNGLLNNADYLYNNVIIPDSIEKIKFDDSYLNLITVSRLSEEKRLDWSIDLVSKLINKGYKIKYRIYGSGKMHQNLQRLINDLNMQENIFLCGETDNPYPYIKASDLTILLSRTESFGIALVESMLLGVPCLTTNTISAQEIVGDYGWVCEHNKIEIFKTLNDICSNINKIKEKKKLLNNYKFDNNINIKRFEEFCE